VTTVPSSWTSSCLCDRKPTVATVVAVVSMLVCGWCIGCPSQYHQPKAVRLTGPGVGAPKSGVCVSGHSMCGAVRVPSNDLRAPATLWYRVPGATGPPAYLPLGPAGLHERPKAGQRG
jgi:hypothetical protein